MSVDMFYLSPVSADVRQWDDAKTGGHGPFVASVGRQESSASRRGAWTTQRLSQAKLANPGLGSVTPETWNVICCYLKSIMKHSRMPEMCLTPKESNPSSALGSGSKSPLDQWTEKGMGQLHGPVWFLRFGASSLVFTSTQYSTSSWNNRIRNRIWLKAAMLLLLFRSQK